MIRRLIKVLLLIPIMLVTFPFEVVYYSLRWIVTGEEFGDCFAAKWMGLTIEDD